MKLVDVEKAKAAIRELYDAATDVVERPLWNNAAVGRALIALDALPAWTPNEEVGIRALHNQPGKEPFETMHEYDRRRFRAILTAATQPTDNAAEAKD